MGNSQLPCYDDIIPALLEYPFEELLEHCSMHPGVPLKPMLAHPTKSLTEVLDRFENQTFTCEFKYDGERAQIHKLPDGSIHVYSRNSENMSGRYPDIMNAIQKWLKPTTESFILDCEAVAWDKEAKKILPFQVLSTRKRKDVKEEDIKSLLQNSLESRRKQLKEAFIETEDEFYFAKHMDSNNIEDIQTFLDVSITSNCEGLMVKSYSSKEATYEPSRRSRNWLKVKKDYLNGVGDSMDLVVVGAYYGRGKRTSVYGAFLLACYDSETEEYQTICKIGTGFSDENLQLFYDTLKDHVIMEPKRFYCLGENPPKPDIWFDPVQVWEVKCADLSLSPTYMAAIGKVDESKGISLRFPRFIRVRDDKQPEDATSSEQVSEFYFDQAQQKVPRDMEMSEDEDEQDADDRYSQNFWDRRIVPDNEYYDSDEGEAQGTIENIKSGNERNYGEDSPMEEQSRTASPMSVKVSAEEEEEIANALREDGENNVNIKSEPDSENELLIGTNETDQTKTIVSAGASNIPKSATESEEEGEVKSTHSQSPPPKSPVADEIRTKTASPEAKGRSNSPFEDALEDGEIAE
ncbi:hypothetical protein G6F56_008651 [Rhizopus delemar]|nr:hypothetical protein G6F56_008651 [Rhizopus delemar]